MITPLFELRDSTYANKPALELTFKGVGIAIFHRGATAIEQLEDALEYLDIHGYLAEHARRRMCGEYDGQDGSHKWVNWTPEMRVTDLTVQVLMTLPEQP